MRELADWRKSHRTIRRRLRRVILIPGVALLAIWAGYSGYSVYEGMHARSVASATQQVNLPAVKALSSVQKERGLSMLALRNPGTNQSALQDQRKRTDQSLAAMHDASGPLLEKAPASVQQRTQVMNQIIGELPDTRNRMDSGQIDKNQTYTFYNGLFDAGANMFETQARGVSDYEIGEGGLQATEILRATDRMQRAAALVADGIDSGKLEPAQHADVARLIGGYDSSLDSTIPATPDDVRQQYGRIVDSDPHQRLTAMENQVITSGPWSSAGGPYPKSAPVDGPAWMETTNQVADDLDELVNQQVRDTSALGTSKGTDRLVQALIVSAATLAVAILAILFAVRLSRITTRRLAALREEALQLSSTRLPEIVERLRRGERVDVSNEVPGLDYGTDEIGQLASAFNTVQHTAVAAAVQEAQAREGVNTVFLGIAHRSQTLVHRQLKLLDKLEHESEDPDQMELLFQLDHLATRARRNAENLIILGGKQPGRRWNKPVELVDVLRSAVAETKHYARVRMHQPPEISINGGAVTDTVHLIAELVDNATSFSPPDSQVSVRGQAVAEGVIIEIEDQGLGMEVPELDAANAVLREPPEFDAMALRSDARLGLFVVARLAARHDVGIELRSSPHGGTRAIVLLPTQVTATRQEADQTGRVGPRTEAIPSSRAGSDPADTASSPSIPVSGLSGSLEADSPAAFGAEPQEPVRNSSGSELRNIWNQAAEESSPHHNGEPDSASAQRQRSTGRHRQSPDEVKSDPASWSASPGVAGETPGEQDPSAKKSAAPEWPRVDQAPPDDKNTRPALPRRRRQANLAPQLAQDQGASTEQESEPTRSPEQIRGLMSAFQQGTHRGRATEGPPDNT